MKLLVILTLALLATAITVAEKAPPTHTFRFTMYHAAFDDGEPRTWFFNRNTERSDKAWAHPTPEDREQWRHDLTYYGAACVRMQHVRPIDLIEAVPLTTCGTVTYLPSVYGSAGPRITLP